MGRVRQLDDDERRPHPVGATPRLLGQARFGKRSPDERYPGSPPAVVIPHVAGYGTLAACTASSCAAGRSPDGSRPISAVPPIATELCAPQRTARSATTRLMHRSKRRARVLDHLVGAGEKRRRHVQAECLSSLEAADALELADTATSQPISSLPVTSRPIVVISSLLRPAFIRSVTNSCSPSAGLGFPV